MEHKNYLIQDNITTLNLVNYQIAELLRIKEELEKKICELIQHPDDGTKSYIYDKYKVTITTGYIYSLDKDEWAANSNNLPKCFNPVRERLSYDLDKNIIRDCEKYGSQQEIALMSKIISKKPKKLHLKLTAAI